MEKADLVHQFATRLQQSMIDCGYSSPRSTSGVNIHKLAEITGYSTQICRKYLSGKAIPEPTKLNELASKLNVSPGWLLFGDSHSKDHVTENKITISRDLLHYIFSHINALVRYDESSSQLPDFLLTLTQDVSQIDVCEEKSKKIIDLALSSAKQFAENNPKSKG